MSNDSYIVKENINYDTGSVDVQISLMTSRIKYLTDHFKNNRNDFHSKLGLKKLVNKRKKLLKYLKRTNIDKYKEIIDNLNLRDSY
ncbi:30S ribosomal protein S15 [Candidatus Legionella polyplacis]|uniref:Small ribosomal subunit protein uS15 n=1 Tax=Candidatus Legionella polyplacis TaxID=2005262 RepID=A0ABZ2GYK0_9GAMM